MIKMVQTAESRWHIETNSGIILTEDIMIGLIAEAEEYIKRYITSYQTWDYKLIPLGRENETR